MNKKKKLRLSGLVILLLAVMAVWTGLKAYNKNASLEGSAEEEIYKVIEIDSSQVREIGIIADDGSNVNLLKDGGKWKALEDESFQVDESRVDDFLTQASSVASGVKIENVTDMGQYGLLSPALNITLQWEDNMYTIKIGDYNSIIDSYYVRVNDENTVYTADSALFYALNKSLGDFEKVEVTSEEQAKEGDSQ